MDKCKCHSSLSNVWSHCVPCYPQVWSDDCRELLLHRASGNSPWNRGKELGKGLCQYLLEEAFSRSGWWWEWIGLLWEDLLATKEILIACSIKKLKSFHLDVLSRTQTWRDSQSRSQSELIFSYNMWSMNWPNVFYKNIFLAVFLCSLGPLQPLLSLYTARAACWEPLIILLHGERNKHNEDRWFHNIIL